MKIFALMSWPFGKQLGSLPWPESPAVSSLAVKAGLDRGCNAIVVEDQCHQNLIFGPGQINVPRLRLQRVLPGSVRSINTFGTTPAITTLNM
jgi:hypothetical protein